MADDARARYGRSPAERFWEKVNRDGPVPEARPDLGPCWLWTASTTRNGYGSFRSHGAFTSDRAHRAAYELLIGPIPDGLHIDHLCRVRLCVNPAHMEAVTQRENTLRGVGFAAENAAKTHCVNGHEYTPENTKPDPRGGRACRECHRIDGRARWARRRAERTAA